MNTLEFVVWQFVRIMVFLEEHGGTEPGSLYADWRDTWQKLDKRLGKLADTDAAAFADLMMVQTVVIDCQSPGHLKDVIQAARSVEKELRAAIRGESNPADRRDLEFEAEGMATLLASLKAIFKATAGDLPLAERRGKGGSRKKKRAKGTATGTNTRDD